MMYGGRRTLRKVRDTYCKPRVSGVLAAKSREMFFKEKRVQKDYLFQQDQVKYRLNIISLN
jgi:hypothetical protein